MTGLSLPARSLGATGVVVPVVGYGTAPLGKDEVDRSQAIRCLHYAIDRGITYLDTSPDYGSEPVVGEVMTTRRDEVFLATKINCRSKGGVLNELRQSLERLKTDHVDLVQVHAVNAWADLEQTLAPDGAASALEEARDLGMTRFIGITGHARPAILGMALDTYPFDTVLVALGMIDRLVSNPEDIVLPRAKARNAGVIAMKVFGHGELKSRSLALRYSLSRPNVSLAIIGMDRTEHIDELIRSTGDLSELSEEEEIRLIKEARPLIEQDAEGYRNGDSSLFWLHDTTVMGWARDDEPARVYY